MQEAPLLSCESDVTDKGFWTKLKEAVHQLVEELMDQKVVVSSCILIY
jgi:hypothetical protein